VGHASFAAIQTLKNESMETATKLNWAIDTIHSQLYFSVKHLGISTVTGTFKKYEGLVTSDDDTFDQAHIKFTLDTNSIDTGHVERDNHLKSPDFFNTAQYPHITFNGTLNKSGAGYSLTGELTILKTTRPITWEVEFGGIGTGRFGDKRAGFEAAGRINRKDFGLSWNILADGGGLIIGEEVKLQFNVQLVNR
jgi:polyisoprenoid-binding protein YceI